MRVVIISQYFDPEIAAAAVRMRSFATELVRRGHAVQIVCEIPNYPTGVVDPAYAGRLIVRRELDGFEVTHVWVPATTELSRARRLLLYGSFAAMAVARASVSRRPDVILGSSGPLSVGAAAMTAAFRHRVPWVLDVRDLWPEGAVALGELSNPSLIRMAERLERRLYSSATRIVTVTEPFRRHIEQRTRDSTKVHVIPNGTSDLWLEGRSVEVDRAALGLPTSEFIWTFAGNIGLAQGLEVAVDAAALLGPGFRLLVVGNGPRRAEVERRAENSANGSVLFRDQVPPRDALAYLRASDALLVPLSAHPALASFVPSKLFDYCAVGRPVIVAAAGESQRLAVSEGAAMGVAPGDPEALAGAVRNLRDDASVRDRLAAAGPRFARSYTRSRLAGQLSDVLEEVVSER